MMVLTRVLRVVPCAFLQQPPVAATAVAVTADAVFVADPVAAVLERCF